MVQHNLVSTSNIWTTEHFFPPCNYNPSHSHFFYAVITRCPFKLLSIPHDTNQDTYVQLHSQHSRWLAGVATILWGCNKLDHELISKHCLAKINMCLELILSNVTNQSLKETTAYFRRCINFQRCKYINYTYSVCLDYTSKRPQTAWWVGSQWTKYKQQ